MGSKRSCEILDRGPKADTGACANILAMNSQVANSIAQPSHRFVLLPEQDGASGRGPRIRRYRLASVGRRSGTSEVDVAMARIARELGRMGRS